MISSMPLLVLRMLLAASGGRVTYRPSRSSCPASSGERGSPAKTENPGWTHERTLELRCSRENFQICFGGHSGCTAVLSAGASRCLRHKAPNLALQALEDE